MRGLSPCVPKSSDVRTIPRPKNSCQMRFTATRAVSGLSASQNPARQNRAGAVQARPNPAKRPERRACTSSPAFL